MMKSRPRRNFRSAFAPHMPAWERLECYKVLQQFIEGVGPEEGKKLFKGI